MNQRTFLLVIALCAIALTITWAPAAALAIAIGVALVALGALGAFIALLFLCAIEVGIWWLTHVARGTVKEVFTDAKGQEVAVVQVGRVRPKTIGVLTWASEREREAAKWQRALFTPGDAVSVVKRGQRFRAVCRGLEFNYNAPLLIQILEERTSGCGLPNDERVLTLEVTRGSMEVAQ